MPLPPMINSVPTLCILPNHEILKGKQILEYYTPISKNIEVAKSDPNPLINAITAEIRNISFKFISPPLYKYKYYTTNHEEC